MGVYFTQKQGKGKGEGEGEGEASTSVYSEDVWLDASEAMAVIRKTQEQYRRLTANCSTVAEEDFAYPPCNQKEEGKEGKEEEEEGGVLVERGAEP